MLQHHASAEENTEKKSVDPQEVITNAESQAQPVAQSKAPTMDNFVFVSPGFLKLHGKGKINRRMYYIANEEKQLACITDNRLAQFYDAILSVKVVSYGSFNLGYVALG